MELIRQSANLGFVISVVTEGNVIHFGISKYIKDCMCNLIGFNADKPEDYYDRNYDSKTKLSIISLSYINDA